MSEPRRRGRRPGQSAPIQRLVRAALERCPRPLGELTRDLNAEPRSVYRAARQLLDRGELVELRTERRKHAPGGKVVVYGTPRKPPEPARWRFIPAGL